MARDRAPAPALNRGQAPDLGFQTRRDHGRPSHTGDDGAESRAGRSAGTVGGITSNEKAPGEVGTGPRKAAENSVWLRMPPRCQRPPAVGYPDASPSRSWLCVGGTRPGAPHGDAGLGASADSAGPLHRRCGVALPGCTRPRSNGSPGRTTSTGTPPRCTGCTGTAGNRGAPPDLLGLDSGAKTGHDLPARSASSRLTRATEVFPQTCTVSRVLV